MDKVCPISISHFHPFGSFIPFLLDSLREERSLRELSYELAGFLSRIVRTIFWVLRFLLLRPLSGMFPVLSDLRDEAPELWDTPFQTWLGG